jgi:hypothetical protein
VPTAGRPDIEIRNALGELIDEAVEFYVGQGAVDVAIPFGEVSIESQPPNRISSARPRPASAGSRDARLAKRGSVAITNSLPGGNQMASQVDSA